jgi:hypothetical protein
MKSLAWIAIIAVAAFGFWRFGHHAAAPSAREVEPPFRAFLLSPESNLCSGTNTLDDLQSVKVGDYSKEFGGWPIYAEYSLTCHNGVTTTKFDGHGGEGKITAAFVRRGSSGGLEVFVPEIFQNATREMQQALQSGLNNIQIK